MNLIFLTLDAWRADMVDSYAGVPLLPVLSTVADRTVRFDNCYATAPWTSPALVSAFTGQSSLRHGVHHAWDRPKPSHPALVARLRAAGFQAPNLSYLNRVENYLDLGYAARESPKPSHFTDDPLADPSLFDALANTPEPFFTWFHYKFTHLPYWASAASRALLGVTDPPPHLRAAVGEDFVCPLKGNPLDPADADAIRRMYAAGVRDADAWIERVFETLDAAGRLDDTCVVLSADHGEELMEHGHVGHASTAEHATLFEEVLRVPFIVVDPRVKAPRTVSTRLSGVDVFSTLLGLAGHPSTDGDGVDLSACVLGTEAPDVAPDRVFEFASSARGYVTPRHESRRWVFGLSDGRHKYIRRHGPKGVTHEVFDLLNDPGELAPTTDGADAWDARLEALRNSEG